ncbi:hypothetical protein O181_111430 [Austropuccinia psidii MF-1]|uniref:Secreted protein n=1 Tax=Austropuccinia psidii MF-1 TaxID=1389203 RepID=A0A9Q3PSI0_9BASI|nr:hypothetical protein [Austropuccinia psidii MF-1]
MFSSSLLLHCHAVLILILASQVQFNSAQGVSCNNNFDQPQLNETSAKCISDGKSYTCDTTFCNFGGHSVGSMEFPDCWKIGKRYSGARAYSFYEDRKRWVIVVYKGRLLNTNDLMPPAGITCAWTRARPYCDQCTPI